MGNQGVAPVSVPTIAAPTFGSISGGLGGMTFPASYVPTQLPQSVAPKPVIQQSNPNLYYSGHNISRAGHSSYGGTPGNVTGGYTNPEDAKGKLFKINSHGR